MSAISKIYLCPPGEPLLIDHNPECPQHERHALAPSDYVEWFEWAASMAYKGHRQSRCPGCDLYLIWSGGRTS